MSEAGRGLVVRYHDSSLGGEFPTAAHGPTSVAVIEREKDSAPLPCRLVTRGRAELPQAPDSAPSVTGSGYSGIEERSGPLHIFLEHATTFALPLLVVVALYFATLRLHELGILWAVIPAIPFTWALGDFVTGLVHWAADTYGTENTPILGRSIIRPFRLHHLYPRDICTHNLVVTIGNNCLAAVPLLAFCLYVLWSYEESRLVALVIFVTVLLAPVTVATNLFHKFAHQENPPQMARWFQRKGIILSPAHHELHHASPFDTHYCITNGWLNPALQKLKFFRGLENLLSRLGIKSASQI